MISTRSLSQLYRLQTVYLPLTAQRISRYQSTLAHPPKALPASHIQQNAPSSTPPSLSPIPTKNLLRSILLGTIFTSPLLFKASLTCLSLIANSSSPFLDPDRNVLIRGLVKAFVYDQFCAGTNGKEVRGTVEQLKNIGFKGVILIYSKEIPGMDGVEDTALEKEGYDTDVQSWREGNLKTLEMVGEGDYVGIKFTGAGPRVARALALGKEAPKQFLDAMEAVCERAAAQNSCIWIDAEQQIFQSTIDKWSIDLMRRWNRNGEALVSLTIQAYLKSTRETVSKLLRKAQTENWTLGIKLVRGAYIGSEIRTKIHDTKDQTDACYDGIASDLLTRSFPGFEAGFPKVELFLAGHNTDSIRKAWTLYKDLVEKGEMCGGVKFGQLLGMADDISCELLQLGERERKEIAPVVYKCMNWGSVRECMHYLVRRARENQSATARMEQSVGAMKKEFWRRFT